MKKVSLFTLVILLGAISTGCYMVKDIPKEKIATYPSIADLYYDKYGAHATIEAVPGQPLKLSLKLERDLTSRAEDFILTTGRYCKAIEGTLQSEAIKKEYPTFICTDPRDSKRVFFVTRCRIIKAPRVAVDSSEKGLMEIWVDQNNTPTNAGKSTEKRDWEGKTDVEELSKIAAALSRERKFSEAQAVFTRIIELEPTNAVAYVRRGHMYRMDKQHSLTGKDSAEMEKHNDEMRALAVADYKKAAELDAKNVDAWYWLGVMYAVEGDSLSGDWVNQNLRNYPKAVEAYNQTIAAWEKVIALNPDYVAQVYSSRPLKELIEQVRARKEKFSK